MKRTLLRIYSKITKDISKIALIIIMICVVWTDFDISDWNQKNKVIEWDIKSYYAYLPAAIIYQDLYFHFASADLDHFRDKLFLINGPLGVPVQRVTYGMSFLYMPFFLPAHGLAPVLGYDNDGYTAPYKFALIISSAFYLLLGLFLLRKILLRWFSPAVTALTLISIALATNLFYYTTTEAPMSHTYSFALIAAYIYFVIRWYEKRSLLNTLLLGFLLGIISLIRPTNIIVILLFALWGIRNVNDVKARVLYLSRSYLFILLMILAFLMVWIPQFIYWKYTSGDLLYYGRGDRGFFFNNPQVLSSLFSYRKGLLLYMPILLLAFTGIPLLFLKKHASAWAVSLYIIINIYILSSWCFWWFGGSYGPRGYIDSYAIMAIPMAFTIRWLMDKKIAGKVIIALFVSVMVYHNMFQTKQYRRGAIHFVAMSKEAYWDSFLHLHPSDTFKYLLRFPDYPKAEKGIYEDLSYEEMFPERMQDEKEKAQNKPGNE